MNFDRILEFAAKNGWAALGLGIVAGLYWIGRLAPDDDDELHREMQQNPRFATIDDEMRYHEERLKHLQSIRAEQHSNEDMLNQLIDLVSQLHDEVREGNRHEN